MNTNSIRQKIAQAIRKMPATIVLQRYTKIDDGMGGYTKSETPDTIATVDGLLDNSGHSFITEINIDAGVIRRERTPKLIIVCSDLFQVLVDDFFTVGGVTYKINNPVNILNLGIYWDCDLEVIGNGECKLDTTGYE